MIKYIYNVSLDYACQREMKFFSLYNIDNIWWIFVAGQFSHRNVQLRRKRGRAQ